MSAYLLIVAGCYIDNFTVKRKAFYYVLYYTNCYNLQEIMSQQSQQRKTRVLILNEETFDQVKRLYKIKSKKELLEITNLSISALHVKSRES